MHGIHENAGARRVVVGMHAMAQVGDMAPGAECLQHATHFGANRAGLRKKDGRIEIALQ